MDRFEKKIFKTNFNFTFFFSKSKKGAIREFFYRNYNVKKDEFIWDGSSENYYNQLLSNLNFEMLENKDVLDIGCGTANLYYWLKSHNINYKSYTGIDFAVKENVISENAKVLNANIMEFDFKKYNFFVLINVLCYLEKKEIIDVLRKVPNDSYLILIEPYPNIFWDKHFNNIQPHYRNNKKMLNLLNNKNFVCISESIDYTYKIGKVYFSPISYCMLFKKSECENE